MNGKIVVIGVLVATGVVAAAFFLFVNELGQFIEDVSACQYNEIGDEENEC